MPNQPSQTYRASIAALLLNDKREILMVQNTSFREDEWDFPKGGMNMGETELQTLERELREELGEALTFTVIKRSNWNVIYEWSAEKRAKEGMRGQARISYWLQYKGGEILPDHEEIRAYKWVPLENLAHFLHNAGWPKDVYRVLLWEIEDM